MFDLNTAVVDGVARVGNSLFPTQIMLDSNGVNAARFLLIARPDGGWAAGAWKATPTGGDPTLIVCEAVTSIIAYTPKLIDLLLADGRRMQVSPDKGCGCGGSKLRMYNPFGESVPIAQVPSPAAAA